MNIHQRFGRQGRRLFRLLHVDRVVVFAIAARIWPFLAGPLTAYLILSHFSEETQGLYYGFGWAMGIQSLFELGFSVLIISMASHEAAVMRGETPGDASQAKQRLASLWKGAVAWYMLMGVLFFCTAMIVGWNVFSQQETTVAWQPAWFVMLPLAMLSVWLAPCLAILEGIGHRSDVYRYRLLQAITGNLGVWAAIMLGLGIWAVAVSAAIQFLWLAYVVTVRFGALFRDLYAAIPRPAKISWRAEVLPVQWRVAIQSIAFYLATQLFTLVIIHYHGLELGGKLGLTMSLGNAVQAVALAWIQTNYAVIAGMAAAKRRRDIDRKWVGVVVVSSLVLIGGMSAFAAGIGGLQIWRPAYAFRFIAPLDVLWLGVGMLANHWVASQSYYILAQRRQPLFRATVFGLSLTAIAVWWGGRQYSISGLVLAYAFITTAVYLPIHSLAFWQDRRQILASEATAT